MTVRHSNVARYRVNTALCLALLLAVDIAVLPAFAAEPPPSVETIDMSEDVKASLNAVIDLINAQKPDEAAAAMQDLRAALEAGMTDYEKFVVLQTSGNLNTTLARYAEAIADYEALLQLPALTDADRLTTANLAGQLYLQQQDWNKGLEHLLAVNDMQGGSDRETLFRIAFAYAQLGQPAAAVPYMEQALTAGGDEAPEDYYKNMALLYIQAKSPAKAIETYEKLLTIAPDSADGETIASNLAALYVEVGNEVKARAALRALINDYPDSDRIATYRQSLTALGGG